MTVVARVGVVGLGAMGAGIAQLCVQAGIPTIGHDLDDARTERGRATIDHYLTRAVAKERMTEEERGKALGNLELTSDLDDLASCDFVIEAAVEDIGIKHQVFENLDRVVGESVVLATNTSALSVTAIAASTSRPERVVGMHFFNPAPLMPLVEVIRAELSTDEAVDTAFALAQRIGKHPVRCHDTPGFVVNRILIPVLNDCIRVLDEARITVEDLDAAMKHGVGWPMGPCELIDLIGIDVHVHASEALYEGLRESRMAPPARLVAMREAGLLGRKSGRGFYRYET